MDKNTKVAKLISGLAKELLVTLPSKDFLDDEKFEDDDMRMDQDDDDDYNASLVSEEGKTTKGGSEGRSDSKGFSHNAYVYLDFNGICWK